MGEFIHLQKYETGLSFTPSTKPTPGGSRPYMKGNIIEILDENFWKLWNRVRSFKQSF